MAVHTYNVKAAELEVRHLLESALARPTAIDRAAYLSQTAIVLMDVDHRAAVLLFPGLIPEILAHIAVAATDLEIARIQIGEINYNTYKNLLDHASALMTSYRAADDAGSYFTADPEQVYITEEGYFAEPTGATHYSVAAWAQHNGIPLEMILAHFYETADDDEGPDYGHHSGW